MAAVDTGSIEHLYRLHQVWETSGPADTDEISIIPKQHSQWFGMKQVVVKQHLQDRSVSEYSDFTISRPIWRLWGLNLQPLVYVHPPTTAVYY